MPLSPGTRLGPYEILSPLGAGGMGEVYKALDTRLDRIVAIKISNERFSERFHREARAVAALNHPHICTLHDVGPDYLVMEYLDGAPIVSHKNTEPLPLAEALRLAIQIAGALEAAHAKCIVHRDLKPANILLTKGGVKLLDFGLARFAQPEAGLPDQASLPDTMTTPLTAAGQIVGTLQYMSPEQLQGEAGDVRGDIFSFGLVLYEMFTGRRAFQSSTQAGLIAAILKEQPQPLQSLLPLFPPLLDRTVGKCLEKDPARRWQTASDLRDELAWIAAGEGAASPAVSRRAFLPWGVGTAAAVMGAAAAGAGATALASWVWRRPRSPVPYPPVRFRISAPEGTRLVRVFTNRSLALSPVGGRVALVVQGEHGSMVWVHHFDSFTARPLEGTQGATTVFWSPDGQFIGFWAGGNLKRIPVDGGPPLPICELPVGLSATWNADGAILADVAGQTATISVQTGAVVFGPPRRWARFLPDGSVLFVRPDPETPRVRGFLADAAGGRETGLMPTDTHVTFTPDRPGSRTGHLLFGRGATLLAQRFDSARRTTSGEPIAVAKDVPFFGTMGWSEFDTSHDGALIYSSGAEPAQLTWLDRAGREVAPVGEPRDFFGVIRLSRDGRKLAADVFNFSQGDTDIWVYDLAQATAERVTAESGGEFSPVWSPDGNYLAFGASVNRPQRLVRLKTKLASGQGNAEEFAGAGFQFPGDWSSDGRWIFYQTNGGEAKADIWVASAVDRKVMPLLQSPFHNAFPALSPDGRHLAFCANDTGRLEIYVQPFEGGDSPRLAGMRIRVSRDGGIGPRWRRDGKELFFLSPDGHVMVVALVAGLKNRAGIEFSPPAALFRLPTSYRSMAPVTKAYEVSADGQRFLVPIRKAAGAPLQVVLNWQAGLTGLTGLKG